MADVAPSAERVQAAATAAGLVVAIVHMPDSTRTAEAAAAACGCSLGQIVKSLVFVGRNTARPYLLLVSGANRVDERGVAAHLGEAVQRPDADYVRDLTGFAIGGIPPIGHATPLATFIDEDLLAHQTVWAAAGTPHAVFSVDPRDLAARIGARPIRVKPAE